MATDFDGAATGEQLRALIKALFRMTDAPAPPREPLAIVTFTVEPPQPKDKR